MAIFCCIGARCSRSAHGSFPLRSFNCTPPSSSSSSPVLLSSPEWTAVRTGPAVTQRKQAGSRGPCRGLEKSRRSVSVMKLLRGMAPPCAPEAAWRHTQSPAPLLLLLLTIIFIFISITACAHWEPLTATKRFPVLEVFSFVPTWGKLQPGSLWNCPSLYSDDGLHIHVITGPGCSDAAADEWWNITGDEDEASSRWLINKTDFTNVSAGSCLCVLTQFVWIHRLLCIWFLTSRVSATYLKRFHCWYELCFTQNMSEDWGLRIVSLGLHWQPSGYWVFYVTASSLVHWDFVWMSQPLSLSLSASLPMYPVCLSTVKLTN